MSGTGSDRGSDGEGSDADPESVARSICLRLLTDRPRTRAELATVLRRREVPAAAAAVVLDRFTDVGLVDDAAFAAAWVESRSAGRGLARRALSGELRRKGIDGEVAEQALGRIDEETELAGARLLVARRLARTAGLAPEVRLRRLAGMLARKGYPGDLATRVVREALAAEVAAGEAPDWVVLD